MPAKKAATAATESDGFSAEERAAMKQRAAELRAEGKKGAKRADGLQAVLEAIEKMAPDDRALAERVHVTVTATAPELSPKTWYGMPAYATEEGRPVVFFQDSGKFKYRYSTLGFQDTREPRRRGHLAGGVRPGPLEPGGGEEGRRAGQGRRLLTPRGSLVPAVHTVAAPPRPTRFRRRVSL